MGLFKKKEPPKEILGLNRSEFRYGITYDDDEGYYLNKVNSIDVLDDLIERFIITYTKEQKDAFVISKNIKNFINKMAVWYEFRYSDDDVINLIPFDEKTKEVYELMFDGEKEISMRAIYNFNDFFNSLKDYEKKFLGSIDYPSHLLWDDYQSRLELDQNGYIIKSDFVENAIPGVDLTNLEGKHIIELLNSIVNKGIRLEKDRSFSNLYNEYIKAKDLREKILTCVMYKIIEIGTSKIGPRRAFLFAKEFGLNIEIPLKYGLLSEEVDEGFIKAYLDMGGSPDIECILDYSVRQKKYEILKTKSLKEIYKIK